MTLNGTLDKAFLFLAVMSVSAIAGWHYAHRIFETTSSLWFLIGYTALISVSLWVASNPEWAKYVGFGYAITQGLWMGAVSQSYDAIWNGVVTQALMATGTVFFVCLILYRFEIVRATPRVRRAVFLGSVGVMAGYLLAAILAVFGVDITFWNDPNWLSIIITVIIAILAALNLIVDFDEIAKGIQTHAPKSMEWYCAFALLTGLLWLYIESLRLISLIREQSE